MTSFLESAIPGPTKFPNNLRHCQERFLPPKERQTHTKTFKNRCYHLNTVSFPRGGPQDDPIVMMVIRAPCPAPVTA